MKMTTNVTELTGKNTGQFRLKIEVDKIPPLQPNIEKELGIDIQTRKLKMNFYGMSYKSIQRKISEIQNTISKNLIIKIPDRTFIFIDNHFVEQKNN